MIKKKKNDFFIDNLIMFVEIIRMQKANKNKKVFWGVLSIHRTCHRGFIQYSLYLRGKNHIMSLLRHCLLEALCKLCCDLFQYFDIHRFHWILRIFKCGCSRSPQTPWLYLMLGGLPNEMGTLCSMALFMALAELNSGF